MGGVLMKEAARLKTIEINPRIRNGYNGTKRKICCCCV
jgi:hypothetical protein